MKLSEIVNQCKALTNNPDPEIRVVCCNGFSAIAEINHRDQYYDESLSHHGTHVTGDFIVLEIERGE